MLWTKLKIVRFIPFGCRVAQVAKNPPTNAGDAGRRYRFDPWVGKIPWRRK